MSEKRKSSVMVAEHRGGWAREPWPSKTPSKCSKRTSKRKDSSKSTHRSCRQDIHSQYTSVQYSLFRRNAHHALGSSHTDCIFMFVRLKRICHLVLHMSHPMLLSHLPFTTSTSSSSFTLPSSTIQEYAARSAQQEQLREHPVHHGHLQAPSVDKLRHSGVKTCRVAETRARQLPQKQKQKPQRFTNPLCCFTSPLCCFTNTSKCKDSSKSRRRSRRRSRRSWKRSVSRWSTSLLQFELHEARWRCSGFGSLTEWWMFQVSIRDRYPQRTRYRRLSRFHRCRSDTESSKFL